MVIWHSKIIKRRIVGRNHLVVRVVITGPIQQAERLPLLT